MYIIRIPKPIRNGMETKRLSVSSQRLLSARVCGRKAATDRSPCPLFVCLSVSVCVMSVSVSVSVCLCQKCLSCLSVSQSVSPCRKEKLRGEERRLLVQQEFCSRIQCVGIEKKQRGSWRWRWRWRSLSFSLSLSVCLTQNNTY